MLENKLKELIIEKFGSVRQFSIKINIPYTTVDSILKRGIDNSNVENIIKICNALDVSIDNLLNDREIIPNNISNNNLTLGTKLEEMLNKISNELNLPIEQTKNIFLKLKNENSKVLTYDSVKNDIQEWLYNNPRNKIILNISKKEWEKLGNDLENQENILNKLSEKIYNLLKLDFEYQPNTEAELDFDLNSYSNVQKMYDTLISLNLIKRGKKLTKEEINNVIDFINNNSNMLKQILDNNYNEYLKEWNNFRFSTQYKKYVNEIENNN